MKAFPTRIRTASDLATFHFAWFGIVWGAAHSQGWLVMASTSGHLLLHAALAPSLRREALYALMAGTAGWAIDTLLGLVGIFHFATALAPAWLWCLWVVFASTLDPGFRWFRSRSLLAGALGLVSGPFSYEVGVRLGALSWGRGHLLGWIALGGIWAMALPLLLAARSKWDARSDLRT